MSNMARTVKQNVFVHLEDGTSVFYEVGQEMDKAHEKLVGDHVFKGADEDEDDDSVAGPSQSRRLGGRRKTAAEKKAEAEAEAAAQAAKDAAEAEAKATAERLEAEAKAAEEAAAEKA